MMGRQRGQMSMVILDIAELIPSDHLLRKINQMVSFDFIYDLVVPYYPANGRPSVDPVSMFKMLLVEYLYGIKSERRLVQEIQLNIAYRWFCGFELGEKIPDHSTFSKTRVRKWNESSLFKQIFVVTRYREMSARNALPIRLVLIRPVCVEEFWPAASILHFTEGILGSILRNTCT